MKKKLLQLISCLLTVILLVPAVPPMETQAAGQVRSAVIYSFTGTVAIRRGGDKEIPVFEGMRLETGDTIITGPDSSAVIAVDADKTISIDAGTEATLDTLSGDETTSDTSVSLFFGSIINSIKEKLTSGSTFETKTANATMGVRGTTYMTRQNTDSVDLVVTSGTVAVDSSESPAAGEETNQTLVDAGHIYHAAPGNTAQSPAPYSGEDLLLLTPMQAGTLFSDPAALPADSLPENITSLDQLIAVLNDKQQAQRAEAKERIAAQKQETQDKNEKQPAPYFEEAASSLSGESNVLLVPKTSEDPESPTPNAGGSASGGGASVPKKDPQPAAAGSKQNPPVSDTGKGSGTTAESGKDSGSGDANSGSGSTGSGSSNGSGNGGSGTGSGSDGSGDNGNDSNGENTPPEPTIPEKPTVSIGQCTLNTVYENASDGTPSETLAFLSVSFQKPILAAGYDYKLKNPNGSFSALANPPQVTEHSGIIRLLFPAGEQGSLSGKVLRITPKTGDDANPVSTDITLDFTAPASDTMKKLSTPNAAGAAITYDNTALTVTVPFNPDTNAYALELYLNGSPLASGVVTKDPATGRGYYTYPIAPLNGSVYAVLKAKGDGYNLFDSETAVTQTSHFTYTIPLAPPAVTAQLSSGKFSLKWPHVENATSYIIQFSNGVTSYEVTSGYYLIFGSFQYDLLPKDKNNIFSVKVQAATTKNGYTNSAWTIVDTSIFAPAP